MDFDISTSFEFEVSFTTNNLSGKQMIIHKISDIDGYSLYLDDNKLKLEAINPYRR